MLQLRKPTSRIHKGSLSSDRRNSQLRSCSLRDSSAAGQPILQGQLMHSGQPQHDDGDDDDEEKE